jgi:hypothetical protein
VSSWGGSVLLADDGKYHMWAAEMTEGVGIKAWITNSQVLIDWIYQLSATGVEITGMND